MTKQEHCKNSVPYLWHIQTVSDIRIYW